MLQMFVCFQFSRLFKSGALRNGGRLDALKKQKKNLTTWTDNSWPKHPYEAQGEPNFLFFKTGLDVGPLRRLSDTIRPLQGCL